MFTRRTFGKYLYLGLVHILAVFGVFFLYIAISVLTRPRIKPPDFQDLRARLNDITIDYVSVDPSISLGQLADKLVEEFKTKFDTVQAFSGGVLAKIPEPRAGLYLRLGEGKMAVFLDYMSLCTVCPVAGNTYDLWRVHEEYDSTGQFAFRGIVHSKVTVEEYLTYRNREKL
ncbi:MAG: hypothetical protein NTV06_02150 [candidate division Zixibacteria bacterium]|nr:hypothetical protein [candidate division Zixibacteria bacterium]